MDDQPNAGTNPYASPEAVLGSSVVEKPVGVGRLVFFIGSTVLGVISMPIQVGTVSVSPLWMTAAVIALTCGIVLTVQRARNIGWNLRLLIGMFIPIANLVLWIALFALPPGFAQSGKLDRVAKRILYFVGGLVIVGSVTLILSAISS